MSEDRKPLGVALKAIDAGEPLTVENFRPTDPGDWTAVDGEWKLKMSSATYDRIGFAPWRPTPDDDMNMGERIYPAAYPYAGLKLDPLPTDLPGTPSGTGDTAYMVVDADAPDNVYFTPPELIPDDAWGDKPTACPAGHTTGVREAEGGGFMCGLCGRRW